MRLSDLAKRIGARCHGDSDLDVISLGTLEEAGPNQITFLGVSTSREMLASCKAGAVILRKKISTVGRDQRLSVKILTRLMRLLRGR